jgi:hypothetical protein
MSSSSSNNNSGQAPEVDPVALPIALLALKTGYGYLPLDQDEEKCKERAKSEGGLAWDEHAKACWKVFGKAVEITPTKDSIKEGFDTVNFNFHAKSSSSAPVPTSNDLPGNTSGLGSPGWSSDSPQFNVGT